MSRLGSLQTCVQTGQEDRTPGAPDVTRHILRWGSNGKVLMAKVARKAAVRKWLLRSSRSKSHVAHLIAEENEIPRKTAAGV